MVFVMKIWLVIWEAGKRIFLNIFMCSLYFKGQQEFTSEMQLAIIMISTRESYLLFIMIQMFLIYWTRTSVQSSGSSFYTNPKVQIC